MKKSKFRKVYIIYSIQIHIIMSAFESKEKSRYTYSFGPHWEIIHVPPGNLLKQQTPTIIKCWCICCFLYKYNRTQANFHRVNTPNVISFFNIQHAFAIRCVSESVCACVCPITMSQNFFWLKQKYKKKILLPPPQWENKMPILWFKLKSLSILYYNSANTHILSNRCGYTQLFLFFLELFSPLFSKISSLSFDSMEFSCTISCSSAIIHTDNEEFVLVMWRFYCFLIWR